MINHARTLLLNTAKRRTHYSDIGYEYVPSNFKPIELPPTLNLVRQILFGASPDNYFLNYRCRELLSYIHSTELAEYIYALDPRVTYWPEINKPFFEPTSSRVSITQTHGAPGRFTVTGNLRSINSLGHAYNQYTIDLYKEAASNDDIVLKLKLQQIGRRSTPIIFDVTSLDTPPILTLPGTEVKLRLLVKVPVPGQALIVSERANNLLAETYTFAVETNLANEPPLRSRITTEDDAITVVEAYSPTLGGIIYSEETEEVPEETAGLLSRWFVETKATPEPILQTAISALEMIGEPASIELFGLENKEPYLTFKNLWFDHPLPVYRLSGMVLALIYRLEALRG